MNGEPGSDAAEALSIAKQLRDLISQILERLADAVKYGKQTRRISWFLGVSLAFDIGLSVVTGAVLIHEAHNSQAIRRSQLQACAIGNGFRAGQRQLWDHVIAVSAAPPGETRAQREARLAKLAAFRVYIGRQFHPVDCVKLYH